MLSPEEKFARLRLIRSENIGPVRFHQLLRLCGNAQDAIKRAPDMAKKGGAKRPVTICDTKRVENELHMLEQAGGRFVYFGEEDYPPLLAEVHDAPPVFAYMGNPELLKQKSVALVGARNASANGRRFTEMLSKRLSEEGYCVISGLARGIDGCAHRAAADTRTIAVVAGGVDHIYPPEHRDLHHHLAKEGGVIAEMPLGAMPKAQHFPRRNRIISGLCPVTVTIEAGLRSGSLITAKMALDQGRTVGAVPGSPLDPRCAGTNDLLRHGATPITGADDVLELLEEFNTHMYESTPPLLKMMRGDGMEERDTAPGFPDPSDTDRARVLELLSATPEDIDALADMSALPARTVSCILLGLELAGRVERHGMNKVSIIHDTDVFF